MLKSSWPLPFPWPFPFFPAPAFSAFSTPSSALGRDPRLTIPVPVPPLPGITGSGLAPPVAPPTPALPPGRAPQAPAGRGFAATGAPPPP